MQFRINLRNKNAATLNTASLVLFCFVLFCLIYLFSSAAIADDTSILQKANAALTSKDYNAAFNLFSDLAIQGNAVAQYNLGVFYLNGQGVEKDEKQAFYLLEKSAEKGNEPALQFIQSAAANGNISAKNALTKFQHSPYYQSYTQPTIHVAPANEPDPHFNTNGTILGAQYGFVNPSESSSSDFTIGVSLGQTGKLTGINNSLSYGLLGDYRFNSKFGVEIAYNLLYQNANADNFLSAATPGSTGTFDLNSSSIAGQYIYEINNDWSLLASLGYQSSSILIKKSGYTSSSGSASGLIAGLKAQYEINPSVGIRAGFDSYTESGGLSGNLNEFGLALIYNF